MIYLQQREEVVALAQQDLSDNLIDQFARQIIVPGVDEEGQQNLSQKRIFIIGLGALGTVASQYLVREGIGDITLIDPDTIAQSNLHRQINYDSQDIGKLKSTVSKSKLSHINNVTQINEYALDFEGFVKKNNNPVCDLILDCTDSHQNKIYSSIYAKKFLLPFVSISINSTEGIYFAQDYSKKNTTCFKCLFPIADKNHRCLNSAMIGPVAGFVTSLACTKIIFALAKEKVEIANEISLIDLLTSDINKLQLSSTSCGH